MWFDENHDEPSNAELGINVWPKIVTYPVIVFVGGLIWYLGYLLFA